jgi:hypothetical protein
MQYNNRSGISIKAKYPKEKLNVSDGTLMNIFSLHEFNKEDGFTSMAVGEINIVTYYTGENMDYYIVLVLNLHEHPENYEGNLKKVSHIIVENLEDEKYIKMLPDLFSQVNTAN